MLNLINLNFFFDSNTVVVRDKRQQPMQGLDHVFRRGLRGVAQRSSSPDRQAARENVNVLGVAITLLEYLEVLSQCRDSRAARLGRGRTGTV